MPDVMFPFESTPAGYLAAQNYPENIATMDLSVNIENARLQPQAPVKINILHHTHKNCKHTHSHLTI